MELRDEGGLTWQSMLVVLICGAMIKIFQQFIKTESMMNDYCVSCSSSRVALRKLKCIVYDIVNTSAHFCAFKGECTSCKSDMLRFMIKPLINTHFNVSADNLTMVLNRREVTKKLSLKIVKELKKKNRCTNESKDKNDDTDMSTWTCDYCKQFLKRHGAAQQGNKAELKERCVLLKHLIANGLENLFALSKTELKSMCADLKFPILNVSKDDMIKNVSDSMQNNSGDTTSDILESIEGEEVKCDVL